MFVAKNLRYLRNKYDFTQPYVSDKLGYKSYTTVQKWESGDAEPTLKKFYELSKLYNVDMNTLYTVDLENEEVELEHKKIPLIGTIAAGLPLLAEENIEDYFIVDSKVESSFALRVKGDSMINANIRNGDIVFIREQPDVENGEIAAVLVDNEATLKRVYKADGSLILQPENDDYKPLVLNGGNVKILGKMLALLSFK